jgi:hypothetical protein
MQLNLAFVDPPPASTAPINPPHTPWEQIDEAARMAALEVLARLIAGMLAAQQAMEMPDE